MSKYLSVNRLGLLGAGISALYNSYRLASRSYSAVRSDPKFAAPMMMKKTPATRSKPNYRRRGYLIPRRVQGRFQRTLVRSTALTSAPLVAGVYGTTANISLQQVQTSDLVPVFQLFRIRKVEVFISPRVDAANSGIVNNTNITVSAACDPEGTTTPASLTVPGSYSNHRQMTVTSGSVFKYTFYPKAVNTVDASGTATPAGSYGMNPWLQLNANGIIIPHRQLLFYVQSSNPSNTASLDWWYRIHFDVSGLA